MAGWKTVYTDEKIHRAEIARTLLDEKGFNPVVLNKRDEYSMIGFYEVQVLPELEAIAKKIIETELRFD